MDQNPYATPQVDLVEQKYPAAFMVDGQWKTSQLRLLAGLCVVQMLVSVASLLPLLLLRLNGFTGNQPFTFWIGILKAVLAGFLLWRGSRFLEDRFHATGLRLPMALSLVLIAVMQVYTYFFKPLFNGQWSGEFIGLALLVIVGGALSLWYGVRLLKIGLPYPSVRVLAWFDISAGIGMILVVLFPLSALLAILSYIPAALMFLRGARELESAMS